MSHPFTWVPGDHARHVSEDPVPPPGVEFPPDLTVTALCGREVTSAAGEIAWLWPTCPDCDDRARELVGAPPRTDSADGEQC
ncbi:MULTISPECIES: zinc finger protein [unclassified Actinopolyspora]|uniref:zinc finger protein n=1 Tax=Actinopolyspora TaxID=1849 RepID=UPI0013F5DB8B|nr:MULTISPECIES: zinc finger protein [unclassified Actinopolyspora]NHD18961.1 hypothetical protein [Actinopolyspora sp. BKK2]NHE77384.1 hypothetical protein [Actinopolyspora sp. BKK1]